MTDTPVTLIPPDLDRCQAVRHEPFRITGINGRCPRPPKWIARERSPGPDGLRGSMSLCDGCRQEFFRRLGEDFADFTDVCEARGGDAREAGKKKAGKKKAAKKKTAKFNPDKFGEVRDVVTHQRWLVTTVNTTCSTACTILGSIETVEIDTHPANYLRECGSSVHIIFAVRLEPGDPEVDR